jgi:hypothetical protein
MTYAGIEYAIRAGVGQNEWVLLISFPDNAGGGPTALHYSGSRNEPSLRVRNGSIVGCDEQAPVAIA